MKPVVEGIIEANINVRALITIVSFIIGRWKTKLQLIERKLRC